MVVDLPCLCRLEHGIGVQKSTSLRAESHPCEASRDGLRRSESGRLPAERVYFYIVIHGSPLQTTKHQGFGATCNTIYIVLQDTPPWGERNFPVPCIYGAFRKFPEPVENPKLKTKVLDLQK